MISSLPPQLTPFVGRTEELKAISDLLADESCRLLTLIGPGGIGKTRLAIEAASLQQECFEDGVYYVALQPLVSAEQLVPVIAQSIGVRFSADAEPKQQLLDALANKDMLLVLDNFEHLLDGAELLSEILHHAPCVVIMTTSRERLNLLEEWTFEVGGLSVPPQSAALNGIDSYSAVQLFAQGAARANRDFSLAQERQHVIRICQLAGGMPLAIELASAWVRALPTAQIAHELEHSLDILETSARNISPRHRNMRAVIDYSWARLTENERAVFQRLSVFRGGFTWQAAQAVALASRHSLASLVDKSWVQYDADTGRYGVHELMRQYGEERLNEQEADARETHDRHCHTYATLLERSWIRLTRAQFKEANTELEIELQNIHAAWYWAIETGRLDDIAAMTRSLWFFYDRGNRFQEGEHMFAKAAAALANADDAKSRAVLGHVLARQGAMCYSLDMFAEAESLLEQSVAILRPLGRSGALAFALLELGMTVFNGHDDGLKGRAYFNEALAIFQELDDLWSVAYTYNWLSLSYMHECTDSSSSEARETMLHYAQESLAMFEELQNDWGIALILNHLSMNAADMGHYEEAWEYARQSMEIYREIDVAWGTAFAYYAMSTASCRMGLFEQAREEVLAGLKIALKYQLVRHGLYLLYSVADLALVEDDLEMVYKVLSFIDHQREMRGQTRDVALAVVAQWEEEPPPNLAAAIEYGRTVSFTTMIEEVITSLERAANHQASAGTAANDGLLEPLTEREMEILRLLMEGLSNRQIAQRLVIALGTVKTHVHNLCSKLGVSSRTQALARARELELL